MSTQIRLEALRLACSVRGVTDEGKILAVAAQFTTFLTDGTVAFKHDVVQDNQQPIDHRKAKKGNR
tara:strand:- start:9830 stop:10027 length:198 start_codon:yes stop_codon:yes gene_type:complete